jgi:hypothetical protein
MDSAVNCTQWCGERMPVTLSGLYYTCFLTCIADSPTDNVWTAVETLQSGICVLVSPDHGIESFIRNKRDLLLSALIILLTKITVSFSDSAIDQPLLNER